MWLSLNQGVANTHTIVSGLEHNVASAQAMVSDIHRTIAKSQEGNDGENLSVGNTHTLVVTK